MMLYEGEIYGEKKYKPIQKFFGRFNLSVAIVCDNIGMIWLAHQKPVVFEEPRGLGGTGY
jgi:hypothetical protein